MWIKQKDEGVGTFYDGISFCKIESGWTSPGAPLDASERNFITVLGTKNAGKNEISEYLFFSFISLQFINNTSFTFVFFFSCIKDSKRKRESRSDCEKEEMEVDHVNGLIKRATRADVQRRRVKRERRFNGMQTEIMSGKQSNECDHGGDAARSNGQPGFQVASRRLNDSGISCNAQQLKPQSENALEAILSFSTLMTFRSQMN